MSPRSRPNGFSLVELLVALAIGALVLTGALRLAAASVAGFQAQQASVKLAEDARFAMSTLAKDIRPAGFPPDNVIPASRTAAIGSDTVSLGASDRLALERWSTHNCYGSPNPITDERGRPMNGLLLVSLILMIHLFYAGDTRKELTLIVDI